MSTIHILSKIEDTLFLSRFADQSFPIKIRRYDNGEKHGKKKKEFEQRRKEVICY